MSTVSDMGKISLVALLSFLLLCNEKLCQAQTSKTDSFRVIVFQAKDPGEQLKLSSLYFETWYNIQRDTLYKYASEAYWLSKQQDDLFFQATAALALSRSYMHWGWIDSAIGYLEPFAKKSTDKLTDGLHLEINRQLALAHGGVSRYPQALELLYHNCMEAERQNDLAGFAASANTIVSVLLSMGRLPDAAQWAQKARSALAASREPSMHQLASILTNYGGYYLAMKNPVQAGRYLDSALGILDKEENLSILPILLRHRAQYFLRMNNIEEADKMLQEMISARSRIAGNFSFLEEKLEMAKFYEQSGFLDKAIKICEENLIQGNVQDSANKNMSFNNDIKNRLPYYNMLVDLYKKTGQTEKYTASLEWLVAAKDSFYSYNNAEAITELQAKYELSEKEKVLAQQKVELIQKNLYLFSGGGLFLLVMGGMIYGFGRYKKKQRKRMEEALAAEKQKSEHSKLEATENERRRIAADLHDNLGAYGAAIKSNLAQIPKDVNAPNIPMQQIEENVQHMVDELGNTIWVLNKSDQTLTSLFDKLKTWTGKLLISYPGIKCRFEEQIDCDTKLSPKQSLNWLYILQEAINNAVKHSKGNLILVRLQAGTDWSVLVKDNGSGLVHAETAGQGLRNMKERYERMGWSGEWVSTHSESGTEFRLAGNVV